MLTVRGMTTRSTLVLGGMKQCFSTYIMCKAEIMLHGKSRLCMFTSNTRHYYNYVSSVVCPIAG